VKVTFRLPSKSINYGYAEAEFEISDDEKPYDLGKQYAAFTLDFQSGEIDGRSREAYG